MSFDVGVASAADVSRMADWAADEGWNPGDTDVHAYFATDPGGFLVGRLDGEPVTCISVIRYGATFGFLGFYITRPDVRGQGYGYRTWQAGMARLAGRNVALDGVVGQQSNYRKSGFGHAWNNIRYEGAAGSAAVPTGVELVDARSIGFDRLAAYDRRFFPEPRDSFLAAWITLPERTATVALRDGSIVGFAVLRVCRAASRIGPLYAESPDVAAALVSSFAAETIAIDIPDSNASAIALAQSFGLQPAFETARMYTGPVPELDYPGLFGVTSLELG